MNRLYCLITCKMCKLLWITASAKWVNVMVLCALVCRWLVVWHAQRLGEDAVLKEPPSKAAATVDMNGVSPSSLPLSLSVISGQEVPPIRVHECSPSHSPTLTAASPSPSCGIYRNPAMLPALGLRKKLLTNGKDLNMLSVPQLPRKQAPALPVPNSSTTQELQSYFSGSNVKGKPLLSNLGA